MKSNSTAFFNKNKTAPQPWQAIAQRFLFNGIFEQQVADRRSRTGKSDFQDLH